MEAHPRQRIKAAALAFRTVATTCSGGHKKGADRQLRELEEDQIVFRRTFGHAWEGVEYELTRYGRTLVPVLTLMAKWGKKHKKLMGAKKSLG